MNFVKFAKFRNVWYNSSTFAVTFIKCRFVAILIKMINPLPRALMFARQRATNIWKCNYQSDEVYLITRLKDFAAKVERSLKIQISRSQFKKISIEKEAFYVAQKEKKEKKIVYPSDALFLYIYIYFFFFSFFHKKTAFISLASQPPSNSGILSHRVYFRNYFVPLRNGTNHDAAIQKARR